MCPFVYSFLCKKGKKNEIAPNFPSQTILISVKMYVQRTAVAIATEMETSL